MSREAIEDPNLPELNFRMWPLNGVWEIVAAFFLWVLLPISIIYFIVSPDARKKSLRQAIRMSVIAYSLFILLRQCGRINTERFLNIEELFNSSADSPNINNFSSSSYLEPSPLVLFFASLFLAGLIIAGVWIFWRKVHPPSEIEQIGREAQLAISKLQAGQGMTDTILACYFEMNRILGVKKGIHRADSTTPREFEQELKELGLPQKSLESLTRLFEQARYGRKEFKASQHQEAIACLNEIAKASESL
ncbi:MAG: DUF4129 domain-containing protein [Anaerolineales bacterium]|jgi:hypothetical protein